jgi:hypothetical protein
MTEDEHQGKNRITRVVHFSYLRFVIWYRQISFGLLREFADLLEFVYEARE